MSLLEKFFKNKKGFQEKLEMHPLEKPLMHDKVYEYHHKKAVLEDGRLYDTESAKKGFYGRIKLEIYLVWSKHAKGLFLNSE